MASLSYSSYSTFDSKSPAQWGSLIDTLTYSSARPDRLWFTRDDGKIAMYIDGEFPPLSGSQNPLTL